MVQRTVVEVHLRHALLKQVMVEEGLVYGVRWGRGIGWSEGDRVIKASEGERGACVQNM